MRRFLLAALIFVTLGPVPGTRQHFPVADTRSQAVAARPLAYPADRTGPLRFVRGWRLVSPNGAFGGFSALAILGPGRFQLAADNGWRARLTLRPDGTVIDAQIVPLPFGDGQSQRKSQRDVEAMAFDPASGKSWIALEGSNQVWRLDPALARIESRAHLPKPDWPANLGPEAMVRLADGRTVIFSEDADDDPRGRAALLFAGDPAEPGTKAIRFFYDAERKGLVSDAALLPDGRILLVHRRLGFDPVFTTILGVLDPADIRPGATLTSQAIGRVPAPLADNYEGIAVSVRDGRTYVWLVSDDNFNNWQRTLLVEFELAGLPLSGMADSKKAAR
ncbi:esterase-like activity of phytase family protein [Sphingopyxis sp.]|uniref:esterase-like activity of phytase family protein n=1 Tax=Sphingopyxis sp. TaxID=1908224 RepID=UPI0035B4DBDD